MNVAFAGGIAMIALGVVIWTACWYHFGYNRGRHRERLRRRERAHLVAEHFDSLPPVT